MKKFNNIILFAGKADDRTMHLGCFSSLALLPMKGKALIYRQLEHLYKEYNIDNFIIVINNDDLKLIGYIDKILKRIFNITIVKVDKNNSIIHSLYSGILAGDNTLPVRVILGDTLIESSLDNSLDVIYTAKVEDLYFSQNWCCVDDNLHFYDKIENLNLENKQIVIGCYSFSDFNLIQSCCDEAIKENLLEISDVLYKYNKNKKLSLKQVFDWNDLGHTSGLAKAKSNLYNARSFNSIQIDCDKGVLIKSSTKIQKLKDEFYWYKNIPQELQCYIPRVFDFNVIDSTAYLKQELYGYPTLQELFLSEVMNIEDWISIIEKLFIIHKNFELFNISADYESIYWLYVTKTFDRINELINQNNDWSILLNSQKIVINGKECLGFNSLIKLIEEKSLNLTNQKVFTIIHGDYCFSNILFDVSNYTFKLIDPRGRLNKDPTIYGDPRYDIAKLRHSIVGYYDFIVNDLFSCKEAINKDTVFFDYTIFVPQQYKKLKEVFDFFTKKYNFNIKEIKFIEAILFLSMIPLHSDNINRQKMFFIKAIKKLNNVLLEN